MRGSGPLEETFLTRQKKVPWTHWNVEEGDLGSSLLASAFRGAHPVLGITRTSRVCLVLFQEVLCAGSSADAIRNQRLLLPGT